ncbi:MAG TPA: NADH-quinone oxidoreductase subunit J [Dehalococcoidia bacterium]|jgi:NADH-quinone oxidoreductase subunit J|nr:NADH-quinone oxidoreductase subunit J [Dehalococcoidia bacterium]
MTLLFFYLMAATVLAGGLGVVLIRSTIYAALFLIMSLVGVAGIYILLSVEFLALVQILIYAGAVAVLIVFALMLTRVQDLKERFDGEQQPLGALTALALLGAFIAMWSQTEWPRDVDKLTVVPFSTIGDALFGRWAVPFEIASGVLLVALVGAIVIAMREEGEV